MLRTKKVLYQQALLETIQKREKLPPESNKAKLITEKIVDFIVLDDHTLSAVENAGFQAFGVAKLPFHLQASYPRDVQAVV